MLYLNASLSNPWYKKRKGQQDYKTLFCKHGRLINNKHWECEGYKDSQKLFGVELSLSLRGRDHAGLEIGICLAGIDVSFRIYDIRHWDYEKNQWVSTTDKGEGNLLVSQNISQPTKKS